MTSCFQAACYIKICGNHKHKLILQLLSARHRTKEHNQEKIFLQDAGLSRRLKSINPIYEKYLIYGIGFICRICLTDTKQKMMHLTVHHFPSIIT